MLGSMSACLDGASSRYVPLRYAGVHKVRYYNSRYKNECLFYSSDKL